MIPAASAVTIVVVSFNSRAMFARQKAALEAQTAKGFKLIYWDNASRPEERPTPNDLPSGTQLIQADENLGFAVANNRAAALAETPFLALLNPDAFPEPTWLEELLKAAARYESAAALGSTQIDAKNPNLFDGLGDAYHALGIPWRGGYGAQGLRPEEGEAFSACAAAALYRKAAWDKANGFEESFFCFGEDVDLGFRLRLQGFSCVQVAAARVAHFGGASAPRRSDFALYYARRNRLWTYLRCMPLPILLLTAPGHLAITFLTLVNALGTPKWSPTIRALKDTLTSLPKLWAQRQAIQKSRVASLASIARALAWSPLALLSRKPVIRKLKAAKTTA